MTDGYALLRAIEANPEEDTPRLAYADWLDENAASESDRARAEFIRVQCELARGVADARQLPALNKRERETVAPYCGVWAKQLQVPLGGLRFERGFIVPLYLEAADWIRAANKIAAVAPMLALNLRGNAPPERDIAGCPELQFVRQLTVSSSRFVAGLSRAPRIQNLHALNVAHGRVKVAHCVSLAKVSFPELRRLTLTGNPIMNRGLGALRQASWFGNLEVLHLQNCEVSDSEVIALVTDPRAARLRQVVLGPFADSNQVAQAILTSPHLTHIEGLFVFCDGIPERLLLALNDRFAERFHLNRPPPW